ncbi:hypothetical protein RUM43_011426 [Polyplax serrata]|uniref:Uncharacterized protein n=1 Tax=Polyplax serrata TaxID=468196 RepID=A0AAN8S097_POLSC
MSDMGKGSRRDDRSFTGVPTPVVQRRCPEQWRTVGPKRDTQAQQMEKRIGSSSLLPGLFPPKSGQPKCPPFWGFTTGFL